MRQQFEDLNAQLIEARQTIQERDRILSLMAGIDRQLVERRRELSLSITQLKYEKRDMQALEGLSLESLYYTLLGRKEEQLEKETAEYLDLKMTTEKCRLTIASLQTQLQNFEAELVILADCDEEYEAIKQQQPEFLASLGNSDSQQLSALNEKVKDRKMACQQLNDVLYAGKRVIEIIDEIESRSAHQAARLAPHLQESLDDFQNQLKAISYQYSSPLQAKKAANHQPHHTLGTAGTALLAAGLVLAIPNGLEDLLLLPFSQPDFSNWYSHLKNVRSQIVKKTEVLTVKLAWLHDEIDKTQEKMEKLIVTMWQAGYFAEMKT